MKHLTILIPDGQSTLSTVACITGAAEMFTEANAYLRKTGREPLFTIELGGAVERSEIYNGHITLTPTAPVSQIKRSDLIIIPSTLIRSYETASKGNQELIQWVIGQYKEGAEIASMCAGTFVLATAGLLDGKSCSTHWSFENNFRTLFPNVNLQIGKLITDEDGIYTNGGAYSFLNLLIYLIEKHYDRPTAIYCSKIFQVDIDRQSQSPFSIFAGQRSHGDDVIREAQVYIENNLHEKISTETLSARFALGRRNFDRRFIKATGNTPLEYQQRVKVESAKRAFETSRKTVNEVMYEVGYSDIKAFREVFKKFTGLPPLDYRGRYNSKA
ncbi:MAG TPA: helix-turn-helix domain-containing protein [Puia sp.]|nr:helix-turn-helix domain-containing protein [Puia sp.]